jgi:dipeptidyl aminopeptidase/acylaminoacyl peptidase
MDFNLERECTQELQLIQHDYGTDINSSSYTFRSPIDHIETVKCPVLLLHGKADKIEPWQEIQDYANEMRVKHKTVKLVLYPDGVHGLNNYASDVYKQISQWFGKCGLSDW